MRTMYFLSRFSLLILFVEVFKAEQKFEYDPNGYIIFCLCMGRFGNQAEHLLGSMSFAKGLNRTFVIPPFRTYKNIPYKEWFKPDELNKFHRSITAEDFMEHIAPKYWPEEERNGFCYGQNECNMEFGSPANSFWKQLGIKKFTNNVNFFIDFNEFTSWKRFYPSKQNPVIALKGAPASYPIKPGHRINQKYMVWSDRINEEVNNYLSKTFDNEKFIGIHLRNGIDWSNACNFLDGDLSQFDNFMASPQCINRHTDVKLSKQLCFPSTSMILHDLEDVLVNKLNSSVRNIYIATDKNPLVKEIEERFEGLVDKVVHNDPWLPVMDLAILARSEYFIGNCVSSFTAFVKRERDINNRLSKFWAT